MNERQFQRLVEQRRRRGPIPLFQSHVSERLLRHAGQAHHRFSDVAAAWAKLADPRWRDQCELLGLRGDTLEIAVRSSAALYSLRQKQAALTRELAALVRGVREIQLFPAREIGPDPR